MPSCVVPILCRREPGGMEGRCSWRPHRSSLYAEKGTPKNQRPHKDYFGGMQKDYFSVKNPLTKSPNRHSFTHMQTA